jgi:hypothetical protein
MNKKALEYVAYQAILESNLSSEQKQRLVEIGIFKKIADWLGAGKDTLTKDMSKFMADRKYQRYSTSVMKNIEKELESIMDAAEKSTGNREVVYDILKAILAKKGLDPQKVATGSGSPPAEGSSSGEGGGSGESGTSGGGEVKPGIVINPQSSSNPEQIIRIIVQSAAEASGMPPEKAQQKAEKIADEGKVDAPKATKLLAQAVAKDTKADAAKVEKIIDFLLKNKHMVTESNRRLSSADLITAIKEIKENSQKALIAENSTKRWQALAGLKSSLLNEETAAPAKEADPKAVEAAKKRFGDVYEDLRKEFKEEEIDDDTLVAVLNVLDSLSGIKLQ